MRRVLVSALWSFFSLAVAPDHVEAQLRTEVIAEGLSRPVAFVPDPTTPTRFFIVEQAGLIRVLENGSLLPTPLVDLRMVVGPSNGEGGLLGMAFSPDAAGSGRFFVNFTNASGDTVVARFVRSPVTAPTVNPTTRFDLRWPGGLPYIDQPFDNHNGGHLAFGPDGHLYIGLGDGGAGNDPNNLAQAPGSLLGKMLRINVMVGDADPEGYDVSLDNPFVDGLPVAALPEIWAFGLRNPWRYNFDDVGPGATNALLIADVGQNAREEVNYEPFRAGGRNYGWSVREGTIATPGVDPSRAPAYLPLTNPVFDYPRTIGRAITGGYVYRGAQLPAAYRGRYFVADSSTSVVGSIGIAVHPASGEGMFTDAIDHTAELGGSLGGVVSFGRDLAGELYLVTFSGRILKIVALGQPAPPTSLSASIAGRTVSLAWAAPASGPVPSGYVLEAGATSGATTITTFQPGPARALTVTDVPDGVYYVRARSVSGDRASVTSNEVRVAIGCDAAPSAPVGLVHTVTGRTVRLDWMATPGASDYIVEAGSGGGQTNLAQLRAGPTPSLVGGAPAGVYFVRVRAANACGLGNASSEIVVTVR